MACLSRLEFSPRRTLGCGLLVASLSACGLGWLSEPDGKSRDVDVEPNDDPDPDAMWSIERDPAYLEVLTYNVAGLPERLSSSNPSRNIPLISPMLNPYDLVLVQEDFAFHGELVREVDHPFLTPPDTSTKGLGDGLNLLSRIPFTQVVRDAWDACNGTLNDGSDCLTSKGFLYTRLELRSGLFLDLYNVHMDAGHSSADVRARASNFRELAQAIRTRSAGVAVIVAGDFNERYRDSGEHMEDLLAEAGLTDTWVEYVHDGFLPEDLASACGSDPNDVGCERLDKILYRSSAWLSLTLLELGVEGASFVNQNGAQLSDHRPVSARFVVVPASYSQAQIASP